jgi:ribosomal protein L14E/L6E/L27E
VEVTKGLVVKSKAGHDKGKFFVVLEFDGKYASICDGKRRKLDNPKQKKEKHLSKTTRKLDQNLMVSNREIRKALSQFQ